MSSSLRLICCLGVRIIGLSCFLLNFQASHLCYWESEDTVLMILKDIYEQLNIVSDDQVSNSPLDLIYDPLPPL